MKKLMNPRKKPEKIGGKLRLVEVCCSHLFVDKAILDTEYEPQI